MKIKRNEKGSYTVEAVIGLTTFVISILALISYISVIEAETAVQNALNNTVSEIVGYCYIADKTIGVSSDGNTLSDDITAIGSSMSELFGNTDDDSENTLSYDEINGKIGSVKKTYSSIKKLSDDINTMMSADENKGKNSISVIASALAKEGARQTVGRLAGNVLGKLLIEKYLPSSEKLEKLGVENGIDGIDLSLSSVLSDGKNVRLVAIYKVNYAFGIFGSKTVCQEASAHAWLSTEDASSVFSDSEIWSLEAKSRGKKFVTMLKEEFPSQAVKEGIGIDLYNYADKKITSVHSVNVFTSTYSGFTSSDENKDNNAENYSIKKSAIKKYISGLAKKLTDNVSKVAGKEIKMTNGSTYKLPKSGYTLCLYIILPLEAETETNKTILTEIADEIGDKYNLGVQYDFRYYALTDASH